MKYQAQRNRLAALERVLPGKGATIVITGGLPPGYAPAKPLPPGSDLKHQHAVITRGAGTPKAPDPVVDTGQGAKIAGRGS